MPSKKKSRSELLNAELNPFRDASDAAFHEEQPAVEDYDAADDARAAAAADVGRSGRVKKGAAGASSKRLRLRGTLDPSLSSGKYAAAPRRLRDADEDDFDDFDGGDFGDDGDDGGAADLGAIDDIFGMLDEDASEQTGGFKSEEQFGDYLAAREKKKGRKTAMAAAVAGGEDDGAGERKAYKHLSEEDANVMRQIDELKRARQMRVSTSDGAGGVESGGAAADGGLLVQQRWDAQVDHARQCVALSAELLSFRLKLQPAVAASLRMPQYYALGAFEQHSDALRDACAAVRREALALTSMVVGAVAEGADGQAAARQLTSSDKAWKALSAYHKRAMASVDAGIRRWGHRAVALGDPKMQAINRPLIEQIQGVIAGKQRLLHRAQRNRGHVHIFGHPHHFEKTAADRAVAIADGDEDREVFDDSDFLKEMAVHHGGIAARAAEKLLPENALKAEAKKGHHRKTKGRTVNYDPRSKLVAFMVPVAYEDDGRYEALLSSLFGRQA